MRSHNPSLLREIVLFILYSEAIESGNNLSTIQIIGRLPDGSVTKTLVGFATDRLEASKNISANYGLEKPFEITQTGYEYVRYRMALPGSAIFEFINDPGWLLQPEAPGDDAPEVDRENQSPDGVDDSWEPLPFERDSEEFKDALRSVEDAEKIIREDNGFSTTYPEIRDNIVWTVGSAVNRLREGLITAGQLKSMLIAPFRKVSSLFAEGLLKEACERAVEKLLALF